ncbi:calmodulin-2/4-like [Impatiens glandulifera]|uniref:calmodulin-2/4-like n=1 Tax=Impatiens glandulifera TaxID=253017 RepID=UPI001FB16280|nr:calmodulin-2/4-like [Impatiens glandulifera]
MAYAFPDEIIIQYKESFTLIDRDCDGLITTVDLSEMFNSFNEHPTMEQIQDMINAADADGDGAISLEDFLILMSKKTMANDIENEIREAFKVFDRDQDGFLSADDVKEVMMKYGERLTDEEAEQIIRESDHDGDGLLNFDEFVRVMMMAP